MKLILIIVLCCTFAAVGFAAGGISQKEFNLLVAPIKELISSDRLDDAGSLLLDTSRIINRRGRGARYSKLLDNLQGQIKKKRGINDTCQMVVYIRRLMRSDKKLDEAFFILANAYRLVGRDRYTCLRMLDDLTAGEKISKKVSEKLWVESKSLDDYITQILREWIVKNGDEKKIQSDDIGVEFKRQLEINDPNVGQVPDLIYNILDESELCSLFANPNHLQDEAAKFARNAFLLEEMSLRNVHPGPLTVQGEIISKLRAYCYALKPQSPNIKAILDRSSGDIQTTGI